MLGLSALLNGRCRRNSAKPNIILILGDDVGFGDLSCYGATKLQTRCCDQLAQQGRRFTDAHSPCAVCAPTRYSLLTGAYDWRLTELFEKYKRQGFSREQTVGAH